MGAWALPLFYVLFFILEVAEDELCLLEAVEGRLSFGVSKFPLYSGFSLQSATGESVLD